MTVERKTHTKVIIAVIMLMTIAALAYFSELRIQALSRIQSRVENLESRVEKLQGTMDAGNPRPVLTQPSPKD
jgi:hypothetical protein